MPASNARLTELLSWYGYQPHVFDEEDANDLIAQQFEQHANALLAKNETEELVIYGGGVRVTFRFVAPLPDSEGFDTFVAPLGTLPCNDFGIFMSTKILAGITSLFTYLVCGTEKTASGITEADMELHYGEIHNRVTGALVFIFLHEYAHILRGHHLYYFRHKLHTPGLHLAMHEIRQGSADINEEQITVHRALEIDADLLALGLFVEFLSTGELERSFLFVDGRPSPSMLGESVFTLGRQLEMWRHKSSKGVYYSSRSGHPHPEIRQMFFDAWFKARKKTDRGEDYLRMAAEMQSGNDKAHEDLQKFGSQFMPELKYLKALGRERVLEEYERVYLDFEERIEPDMKRFFQSLIKGS